MHKRYYEILHMLKRAMDVREEPFRLLHAFEKENGFVPAEYQKKHKFIANYEAYKRTGGWRNVPGVLATIRRTAKLMLKNERRKKK